RAGNPDPPLVGKLLVAESRVSDLGRHHADCLAAAVTAVLHGACGQCEKRVVSAASNIHAGVELGPPLPDQDLTGLDDLAAVALHPEVLRVRVAAVARAGSALLVCHDYSGPHLLMPVTSTRVSFWRRSEEHTSELQSREN